MSDDSYHNCVWLDPDDIWFSESVVDKIDDWREPELYNKPMLVVDFEEPKRRVAMDNRQLLFWRWCKHSFRPGQRAFCRVEKANELFDFWSARSSCRGFFDLSMNVMIPTTFEVEGQHCDGYYNLKLAPKTWGAAIVLTGCRNDPDFPLFGCQKKPTFRNIYEQDVNHLNERPTLFVGMKCVALGERLDWRSLAFTEHCYVNGLHNPSLVQFLNERKELFDLHSAFFHEVGMQQDTSNDSWGELHKVIDNYYNALSEMTS